MHEQVLLLEQLMPLVYLDVKGSLGYLLLESGPAPLHHHTGACGLIMDCYLLIGCRLSGHVDEGGSGPHISHLLQHAGGGFGE